MIPVSMLVNGRESHAAVEPRTQLAELLRDQLRLTGTHLGCEQGVCGACTVLIDGKPQRACIAFAVDCSGAHVTTIEGLDDDPVTVELREAFRRHHALQCGFCTPGMLVTARDIVMRLGEVPEQRIREELGGNLCRCTGYLGIVDAVLDVCAGKRPSVAAPAHAAPLPLRSGSHPAPDDNVTARPVAARATAAPLVHAGSSSIEERFSVAAPPEAVWVVLADVRRVASCVPGAEIVAADGDQLTARMRVALGPIKASFNGHATMTLDHAARAGTLAGRGRDGGTSIEGEARWRVTRDPADDRSSIVTVALSWRLSGALAQFNRVGLIQELGRRLTAAFAVNLQRCVAADEDVPPVSSRPLGLLDLLWNTIKTRLFGRS